MDACSGYNLIWESETISTSLAILGSSGSLVNAKDIEDAETAGDIEDARIAVSASTQFNMQVYPAKPGKFCSSFYEYH